MTQLWCFKRSALAAAVAACLAQAAAAHAAPLIINGGFESGFAGWTVVDAVGSEGTFFLQTGTASPLNGDPVPMPPGPAMAAMTDAFGPGSHVLYQDFVAPSSVISALLQFDLFIGNRADRFATPGTLDWSTPLLNQQVRVDILLGGTDPFSVAAGDVLLTVYKTLVGDPLVAGYAPVSVDLTALLNANAGQTLRLRFAEVDNLAPLQLGVDNVQLEVPEPSSLLLLAAGLAALGRRRRSR